MGIFGCESTLDKHAKKQYNIARYEKAMTRKERGEPPAKASRGWCKPGGRNACAALRTASGEEPAVCLR